MQGNFIILSENADYSVKNVLFTDKSLVEMNK